MKIPTPRKILVSSFQVVCTLQACKSQRRTSVFSTTVFRDANFVVEKLKSWMRHVSTRIVVVATARPNWNRRRWFPEATFGGWTDGARRRRRRRRRHRRHRRTTAVDAARRRDEIAPPPGGTRCRDDELSAREICKSNRTGPAAVLRPPLAKRFTEMSIFLFRVRALILERAVSAHGRPRLYDPVN